MTSVRFMTISPDTQNMMRLLSQVILADGHILQSEIEAFVKSVQTLNLSDETGAALTDQHIRAWFDAYLVALNETDTLEPKDVAITRLILSLAEWPDKQSVVETLENISRADADFHMEEKLLISIVKAYWQYEGLDSPGSTIGA